MLPIPAPNAAISEPGESFVIAGPRAYAIVSHDERVAMLVHAVPYVDHPIALPPTPTVPRRPRDPAHVIAVRVDPVTHETLRRLFEHQAQIMAASRERGRPRSHRKRPTRRRKPRP